MRFTSHLSPLSSLLSPFSFPSAFDQSPPRVLARDLARMSTPPRTPDLWTDPRHRDGWEAELVAGRFLTRRGWRIEAHRFRLGRNDLDLIARCGSLVAFIEVKCRRSTQCGDGAEAVGGRKRATIERLAWAWLLRHGRVGDEYRFDVITLNGTGPAAQVTHIEDAWRPRWR
jgi:putative endonuclease